MKHLIPGRNPIEIPEKVVKKGNCSSRFGGIKHLFVFSGEVFEGESSEKTEEIVITEDADFEIVQPKLLDK